MCHEKGVLEAFSDINHQNWFKNDFKPHLVD